VFHSYDPDVGPVQPDPPAVDSRVGDVAVRGRACAPAPRRAASQSDDEPVYRRARHRRRLYVSAGPHHARGPVRLLTRAEVGALCQFRLNRPRRKPEAGRRTRLLADWRIADLPAFVGAPLGGMTRAKMGAAVIRIAPIGGGIVFNRWPVTKEGASLYWA